MSLDRSGHKTRITSTETTLETHTHTPLAAIDQVAGYVDINQQPHRQSAGYDLLPMKDEDSDLGGTEATQSDLSQYDQLHLTPHPLCQPDTADYDRLTPRTTDSNQTAQSPLDSTNQSDSCTSHADMITMDSSESEVNERDQSDWNKVNGTDQSDPRTKRIPPQVPPKPRRSNAGIKSETLV